MITITGVLTALTALHIGSGAGNDLSDSLLRRDVDGNLLIPGTAIAGVLRTWLTRTAPLLGFDLCLALWPQAAWRARQAEQGNLSTGARSGCGCPVCRLMGDIVPTDGAKPSAASRLYVYNAPLMTGGSTQVRDGVGIDRQTGAAARAARAKFSLETLPAGAQFRLHLELREPRRDSGDLATDELLLAALLAEWQEGRLRLGGDTRRGLGAFRLGDLAYQEQDLHQAETLMAYLRAPDPRDSDAAVDRTGRLTQRLAQHTVVDRPGVDEACDRAHERIKREAQRYPSADRTTFPVATGWVRWDLTLQATGPFLTHDTTTAGLSGFDHAPALATTGDWTQPLLPGSAIRGVMRAHAERIARTLATASAIKEAEATGQDAGALFRATCPACDPLAHRRRSDSPRTLESCDSLLRHPPNPGYGVDENDEVPPERLCMACQLFGSTRLGSRLFVEDAAFVGDGPVYKMLDFLAIDRFTGGGAEHLKFDALVLWKPAFNLRVWLEDPVDWELGWLSLVFRDLAEGWLRLGMGAAKGFGQVEVGDHAGTVTLARPAVTAPTTGRRALFETIAWAWGSADLVAQQAEWVKAYHRQLADRSTYRQQLALPEDSYFGKVDHIYREVTCERSTSAD